MMVTEMRNPRVGVATMLGQLMIATLLQLNPGMSHAQTPVHELDNPARQPFQAELRRLTLNTPESGESFQVAVVPSGKRLAIEHISLRIRSREAVVPGSPQPRFLAFAALVMKADGVPARHELIVNRADVGAASFNVASQSIRAYADPGSPVFVQISCLGDDDGNSSLLEVTHLAISGHLVDLP